MQVSSSWELTSNDSSRQKGVKSCKLNMFDKRDSYIHAMLLVISSEQLVSGYIHSCLLIVLYSSDHKGMVVAHEKTSLKTRLTFTR